MACREWRDLNGLTDIAGEQKRRPALVGGQGADVGVGLGGGAQHGLVPAAGFVLFADLLGFEHEMPAPVKIDVAAVDAAVGVVDIHAALEHVGILFGVGPGRLGAGQGEQLAQLGEEKLVVGTLQAVGIAPAVDEGFDIGGRRR